jgi:tetratricopeptide (TPR) repeat protein
MADGLVLVAGSAIVLASFRFPTNTVLVMLAFLAIAQFLVRLLIIASPLIVSEVFGIRPEGAEHPADRAELRRRYYLGLRLCAEGRIDEAEGLFSPAQAASPADATPALLRAWCLRGLGRYREAITVLEQARRGCPDDPVVAYALACLESRVGRPPVALDWLSRALEREPGLRDSAVEEPDFEPVRLEDDYARLTSDCDPAD